MSEIIETKFMPEYQNNELKKADIKIVTEINGNRVKHDITMVGTEEEGVVKLDWHKIPQHYNESGFHSSYDDYNLNDQRFKDIVNVRNKLEELLKKNDLEWEKQVNTNE